MADDFDSTSELLKHARQISLALVAASFIIFSTFIFSPENKIAVVIDEFSTLHGLAAHWNAHVTASSTEGLPITYVFSNNAEREKKFNVIDFSNVSVGKVDFYKEGVKTIAELNCNLKNLLIPPEFIKLSSGEIVRIDLFKHSNFEELISHDGGTYFNSIELGEMINIKDFVSLWNLLSRTNGVIKVDSIHQGPVFGFSEIYENDDAEEPINANYLMLNLSEALIRQHRDTPDSNIMRNTQIRNREIFSSNWLGDTFYKYLPKELERSVDTLYQANEYIITFTCRVETQHEKLVRLFFPENSITFISPVETTTEIQNLQKKWLSAAIQSGFITSQNALIGSGSFPNAFPELSQFITGLGDKPIASLKEDLDKAKRAEIQNQAKQIQIMGISLNPSAVRYTGILLLVVLQGYLMMHVSEAKRRVLSGMADIKASYVPWIAIYDGIIARITFGVMTCLIPLIAIFSLTYWSFRSSEGTFDIVLLIATSGLGIGASSFIGFQLLSSMSIVSEKLATARRTFENEHQIMK